MSFNTKDCPKILLLNRKHRKRCISQYNVASAHKVKLDLQGCQVDTLSLPFDKVNILTILGNIIYAFLVSIRYDIVHQTGDAHYIIPFLCSLKVLTVHDCHNIDKISTNRIASSIYKLVFWKLPLNSASKVIAISDSTATDLSNRFKILPSKLHCVPNILSIVHTPLESASSSTVCSFIPSEKLQILLVGTSTHKNVSGCLEAIKHLPFPTKTTIVGPLDALTTNQSLQILRNRYDHHKLEVHQSPTDLRLKELYRKSHVLLFATFHEGFGMPIIEAQANGCLVITSNTEPHRSVSGPNGALLCDPYSPQSIAQCLIDIHSNISLRTELLIHGLSNAHKYSLLTTIHTYLGVYNRLYP